MKENITKEGIEVKVGQVWRDCDKRMNGRTRKVVSVNDGKAQMDGPTKTSVSIRRMHKSSTGWELVTDTNKMTDHDVGVMLAEDARRELGPIPGRIYRDAYLKAHSQGTAQEETCEVETTKKTRTD
jgi:hypothetical protein